MTHTDPAGLAEALLAGATLVDVREPAEFARAHVPGARLVPMGQLPARMPELAPAAPVYVICRSGNRSGAMVDLLRASGIEAVNVAGGTDAWIRAGRPVEGGLR